MASYSKRKDTNGNGAARPLMPRLAASVQSPRSSPAPKLAGYSTPSPQAKRPPVHTTPSLPSTKPKLEDKATPVTNFVTSNITPRSSSRKSRADSSQSTPVNGPDNTQSRILPSSPLLTESPAHGVLTGTTGQTAPNITAPKLQQIAIQNKHRSLPTSPNAIQLSDGVDEALAPSGNTPSFFHADTKPIQERHHQLTKHKKTSSFVYANGTTEKERTPSYSNMQTASKPSTFVSASPHYQPLTGNSSPPHLRAAPIPSAPRQTSPSRQGFHPTYRKGASQIMPPQPLSPPTTNFEFPTRSKSSVDGEALHPPSQPVGVSSLDPIPNERPAKKESGFPFLSMFSLPSSRTSPMISPTGDGISLPPSQRNSLQLPMHSLERTQSPPSAVGSSESDAVRNEAAAHARRERKIMDLEISNSSLLVINRSLEKEARRQKAELRRYKRLSRNSSLFSEDSVRSSERLSILTEEDDEIGLTSDRDLEEDDESSDSLADEPTSPDAIAQQDARHRKSDQLRLKKDLAKHKEILADSHKINQSLMKCLGVTEQLISDGRKALEHKVDYEDIWLGGRVLSLEEQGIDLSSSRAPSPLDESEFSQDRLSTSQATSAKLFLPPSQMNNGSTYEHVNSEAHRSMTAARYEKSQAHEFRRDALEEMF